MVERRGGGRVRLRRLLRIGGSRAVSLPAGWWRAYYASGRGYVEITEVRPGVLEVRAVGDRVLEEVDLPGQRTMAWCVSGEVK